MNGLRAAHWATMAKRRHGTSNRRDDFILSSLMLRWNASSYLDLNNPVDLLDAECGIDGRCSILMGWRLRHAPRPFVKSYRLTPPGNSIPHLCADWLVTKVPCYCCKQQVASRSRHGSLICIIPGSLEGDLIHWGLVYSWSYQRCLLPIVVAACIFHYG